MASTTPVPPVPHEAVARVIGRAVELGDEHAAPFHSDDLDEHALVDIGRDVGVSPDAVRAALAEYHAGMLPDAGRQQPGRLVGPRLLVVERSVPGPLAHVGAMVDELLEQQVFECCRRAGNRSVWRPREDLLATFQRAARKFSRGRPLRHVTELTVGLTEVPAATGTPVHVRVRMAAELRSLRQGYVVTTFAGTVAGGGGVATAVGASLFADPLALLGLVPSAAVAAGAWFGPRAGYRHRLAEAELVIQGGLDDLVLRLGD